MINRPAFYRMKKLLLFLLLPVLFGFTQGRRISSTTKKIVYARDGGKCRCCGSTIELEYDHIKPYSCGGSNDRSNIQLLCQKCNRSKSNSCHCKIHDRKVGVDCCDEKRSSVSSSSGSRSVTARQCIGRTKNGARCRNRTTNASGRCRLH